MVARWLAHERKREGWSQANVNRYVIFLRMFGKWLVCFATIQSSRMDIKLLLTGGMLAFLYVMALERNERAYWWQILREAPAGGTIPGGTTAQAMGGTNATPNPVTTTDPDGPEPLAADRLPRD